MAKNALKNRSNSKTTTKIEEILDRVAPTEETTPVVPEQTPATETPAEPVVETPAPVVEEPAPVVLTEAQKEAAADKAADDAEKADLAAKKETRKYRTIDDLKTERAGVERTRQDLEMQQESDNAHIALLREHAESSREAVKDVNRVMLAWVDNGEIPRSVEDKVYRLNLSMFDTYSEIGAAYTACADYARDCAAQLYRAEKAAKLLKRKISALITEEKDIVSDINTRENNKANKEIVKAEKAQRKAQEKVEGKKANALDQITAYCTSLGMTPEEIETYKAEMLTRLEAMRQNQSR
jgi:hypothetical protein